MASESFASGFDHGRSRPCLSKPDCEPRTCCAPFALRFLPGVSLTVPASEAAHLLPATMERRSFLRLEPQLGDDGWPEHPALFFGALDKLVKPIVEFAGGIFRVV